MVPCIEVESSIASSHPLFSLPEKALGYSVTARIPFFAQFIAAPEETFFACDVAGVFLRQVNSAPKTVVTDLGAMSCNVNGCQPISGVPFVRRRSVVGEIS